MVCVCYVCYVLRAVCCMVLCAMCCMYGAMCYVLYVVSMYGVCTPCARWQHLCTLCARCARCAVSMYTVCKVAAVNQILIFKYISFLKINMDKPCHFPIYPSKFTMLVVPNAHAKSLWSTYQNS